MIFSYTVALMKSVLRHPDGNVQTQSSPQSTFVGQWVSPGLFFNFFAMVTHILRVIKISLQGEFLLLPAHRPHICNCLSLGLAFKPVNQMFVLLSSAGSLGFSKLFFLGFTLKKNPTELH